MPKFLTFSHAELINFAVLIGLAGVAGLVQGIRDQMAISRHQKWWREGGWRQPPPAND